MNNKIVLPILILLLLVAFAFLYQAPAQGLQQLPEEGSLLVLMLVSAAVTWALVELGTVLGIDLGGYVAPIAAVLSPLIITLIEGYLQLIPPIFDNLVLSIIHLIVLAVGSIGTLIAIRRTKEKDTKALLA